MTPPAPVLLKLVRAVVTPTLFANWTRPPVAMVRSYPPFTVEPNVTGPFAAAVKPRFAPSVTAPL